MNKHLNITNRTIAALALSLVAIAGLGISCNGASGKSELQSPISNQAQQLIEYRWIGTAVVAEMLTGKELFLRDYGTVLALSRIEARQLANSAMTKTARSHGKILQLDVEITGAND